MAYIKYLFHRYLYREIWIIIIPRESLVKEKRIEDNVINSVCPSRLKKFECIEFAIASFDWAI